MIVMVKKKIITFVYLAVILMICEEHKQNVGEFCKRLQ